MQIDSGDGFILTNGRRVRVGSVYDVYDSYETDSRVGHEPETRVRYSHWWDDGRLVAARDDTLADFIDTIDERVPQDDLPDEQSPSESRTESHW